MSAFGSLVDQLAILWAVVVHTWWLWAPVALVVFGKNLWRDYLKVRYFSTLQWVLLEIRIPREIMKSPEAMEQVFAGLQGMYWGFDPWETWWQGLQHDYLVFEVASMGGETRFYVRLPIFFRNLVEAQIYAQYPEAEIVEAEDYLSRLPGDVPNAEWDMFGVEFKFEKEDAYPIRTYIDFRSLEATKVEQQVDPFAAIAELMGKIGPGEHLGYHLLLRPAQTGGTDKWRKDGEALVAKLIGKRVKPPKGKIARALEPLEPVTTGWGEPVRQVFGLGSEEAASPKKKEEPSDTTLMMHLSPGTKDIVAAIERNILKPGFEVVVRMCYAAKRDVFNLGHVASFVGSLKLVNTQTTNAFKLNTDTMAAKTTWWLPAFVTRGKKQHKKLLYWRYYRGRKPFKDTWSLRSQEVVMNTEELATIYHYPGASVKAPLMPRIEAKRAEPPAMLPVG